MALRFETIYKIVRRMNLADPEVWNDRFRDVDRRVDATETALSDLDAVANRVEGTALDRINNVVTPLVVEVITRLQSIANLFSATSVSTVDIGAGTKTFIIADGERNTFAVVEYVTVHPLNDTTVGMTGAVVSYDATTGTLVLDVADAVQVFGSGTFSEWKLSVSLPPDLTTIGALRDGVPDERDTLKKLSDAFDSLIAAEATTRANADTAEATARNTAIAAAITALKAGVGTALDTLNELAAALGNDANFSATVMAALGNRLRFDAAQVLTGAQQTQAQANLGISDAPAGRIRFGMFTTPASGWILLDDGTIGNAASGATSRANADCLNCFIAIYMSTANTECAVSGGRTGSTTITATADFNAGKTIALPKFKGRGVGVYGAGSGLTSRAMAKSLGEETHTPTLAELCQHNHTGTARSIVGYGYSNDTGNGYNYINPDSNATDNSGSSTPFNVMSPITFVNGEIKL